MSFHKGRISSSQENLSRNRCGSSRKPNINGVWKKKARETGHHGGKIGREKGGRIQLGPREGISQRGRVPEATLFEGGAAFLLLGENI